MISQHDLTPSSVTNLPGQRRKDTNTAPVRSGREAFLDWLEVLLVFAMIFGGMAAASLFGGGR